MTNAIFRMLDLYIRVIVLILAVTVGVAFLFIGARAALAANLKPLSIIKGDTLTLGDVFDGLDEKKAAYVLGPAPQPGQDMVLNASTLMRVALALDLPWRPATSADQSVIRRTATVLAETDIRATLERALKDQGLKGKFNLQIAGNVPQMILPPDVPASVEAAAVKFDPSRDMFEISLAAPSAETPLTRASVMGRVQRLISVPVLKNTMRNGDLINNHDIVWIDVDAKDIQPDTVLKEEDLSGLTPRRIVAAGKPLRATEFQRPQLVSRGDTVTLVFQSGPLTLTARGKALQNGSQGDLVRFVNTASNRTLDGTVSGDHEITVSD